MLTFARNQHTPSDLGVLDGNTFALRRVPQAGTVTNNMRCVSGMSTTAQHESQERKGCCGMDYERFAPLVTPHTATITRVAAALVGLADAEDAAQEALLRAWRAWPTLREADSTRAWLLQITVNVCHTWGSRTLRPRQGVEEPLETTIPLNYYSLKLLFP